MKASEDTGGKGASMRWLKDQGYPCPEFEILSVEVWADLLDDQLSRHLKTVRFSRDQLAFSLACYELRTAIMTTPLPAQVVHWLDSAPLTRLGVPLAVRSSAASEDGASASSAGQYESILGVSDRQALVHAIREVLASYFGERAALYRRTHGLDDGDRLAMAVIIQRLVKARVSGIAFSIDPVSGSSERSVIEATAGLGPTLVSGEADPDRFYVERSTSETVEQRVGRKATVMTYDEVSGTVSTKTRSSSVEPCITAAQAQDIARDVVEMEQRSGRPVDVEWALSHEPDARPIYLQVRPVTTFEPKPSLVGLTETF